MYQYGSVSSHGTSWFLNRTYSPELPFCLSGTRASVYFNSKAEMLCEPCASACNDDDSESNIVCCKIYEVGPSISCARCGVEMKSLVEMAEAAKHLSLDVRPRRRSRPSFPVTSYTRQID